MKFQPKSSLATDLIQDELDVSSIFVDILDIFYFFGSRAREKGGGVRGGGGVAGVRFD